MQDYVIELRETVEKATPRLLAIGNQIESEPAEPGRWSRREIIGHLIDSAANNHRRFVLGQLEDNLDFPGYRQEEWVKVQRYAEAPWEELVDLWQSYNLHLARVMDAVSEEIREKEHRIHSFKEIAWQMPDEGKPATLDYLMRDYVGHLKNHLVQIFGKEGSEDSA